MAYIKYGDRYTIRQTARLKITDKYSGYNMVRIWQSTVMYISHVNIAH